MYVDDLLLLSDDIKLLEKTKCNLNSCFKMMDLGEACWILNIEVICDCARHKITFSQANYIEGILECHGMADCKPVTMPMEANLKLNKLE